MNRKEIKAQAKKCLENTGREPKLVTLVFLICAVVTVILRVVLVELALNMDSGGKYLSDSLTGASKSIVASYGVAIAFQFLLVLLCAGYTVVALELRRRNQIGYGTLLAGFRMAGRVLATYLLTMLFMILWAYAFTLPLSYLLVMGASMETPIVSMDRIMALLTIYICVVMLITSYRYRMAFFLLMDDPEMTARQAVRQATAINKGHRRQLFLLDLSFVPWVLLCILTCGVLLIWKLPYIITTYAGAYDALMTDYAQRQLWLKEKKMFQEGHGN